MTITAPCREVLSLQFAQRDDLNDGLCVGPRLDRELVASRFTEDYDVTLALATDQKFFSFTSDLHRIKRFMRFNCVGNALSELVPDLEGVVEARRDELFIVDRHDTSHFVLMSRCRLKVSLTHDNILIDIGFHFLWLLCSSLGFLIL